MKKSYGLLVFICSVAIGQNTFPTAAGTNVGIGTTSPSTRLQITSGTANTSGVRLTNLTSSSPASASNNKALSVDASGNVVLANSATLYSGDGTLAANRIVTLNGRSLRFNSNTAANYFFMNGTSGNIGLGTTAPSSMFDVAGKISANSLMIRNSLANGQVFASGADMYNASSLLTMGSSLPSPSAFRLVNFFDFPSSNLTSKAQTVFNMHDRDGRNRFSYWAEQGGSSNISMADKSGNQALIISENDNTSTIEMIKPESYIGIGTTAWNSEGYKLSVNGGIRANRVKVYTDWADYVFEPEYNLPTLEEVEQHIKDKGHLIDIPSAATVEKDGIELGEMNKLLLQKVEELTLYVLQLKKEVDSLKNNQKD